MSRILPLLSCFYLVEFRLRKRIQLVDKRCPDQTRKKVNPTALRSFSCRRKEARDSSPDSMDEGRPCTTLRFHPGTFPTPIRAQLDDCKSRDVIVSSSLLHVSSTMSRSVSGVQDPRTRRAICSSFPSCTYSCHLIAFLYFQ